MPFLAPVRSVASTAVRIAGLAARPAVRAAKELVRRLTAEGPHAPAGTSAPAAPTPAAPGVPQRSAPSPPSQSPSAVHVDRAQPEFEPLHTVEEPPEIVHSTADAGAVDGVGATLRIDEPWSGYRGMSSSDVVDRLVVADRATLAAVALYETSHRARATVLRAAEEHLKRAVGRD